MHHMLVEILEGLGTIEEDCIKCIESSHSHARSTEIENEALRLRVQNLESGLQDERFEKTETNKLLEDARHRLNELQDELRDQDAARSDASSRIQEGLDREAHLSTQCESSLRNQLKEKARADALEASVQRLAEELSSCERRIDAADSKCLDAIAREE
eukprot:95991-Rhodomonas_salina.1